MNLNSSVKQLDGVGETLSGRLQRLNIESIGDLLEHYPREYNDFSRITKIVSAKPGMVTLKGEITSVNSRRTQKGRSLTEALISDDSGSVQAVWFNQPYLAKQLPRNKLVYVTGELAYKYSRYALQNPVVEPVSSFPKDTARIVPVYSQTENLSSKQLRRLLSQALQIEITDPLPEEVRRDQNLIPKDTAMRQIHFPDSTKELEAAKYRLAFEEVYLLLLRARELKRSLGRLQSPRIRFDEKATRELVDKLPFKLTDDQRKAAWRILQDMDSRQPMNRLLQGDVGSGKTVVAALAALQAGLNGLQTLFMAPTEILARQHYETLSKLLKPQSMEVVLLSSGLDAATKQAASEAARSGSAQVVVGTHALLQPDVKYADVGLAVIDEQHRFGVEQRRKLRHAGREGVHVLSMSATPIPRTLALTVYGDLDVSNIRQMPEGRLSPETKVVHNGKQVYEQVYSLIRDGGKVFVVCPLIEDSEVMETTSVQQEVDKLKRIWPQTNIAGVHGRMDTETKAGIIDSFHRGDTEVLVATTIVEVGIDVADANVMLVEGAERFGLATLHQLRGRVGRSGGKSFCFIKPTNPGQAARRLELLESHNDGFTLAEEDLKLRGAGAVYGRRQHGIVDLKLADIEDTQLFMKAKKAVDETDSLENYPRLKQALEGINKRERFTPERS